MADPQTQATSTDPPPPPLQPPPDLPAGMSLESLVQEASKSGGPTSEIRSLMRRDQAETERYEKEVGPMRQAMIDSINQDRAEREKFYQKIPPLNLEAQPKPRDYETDPVSAFGSFASIFAQVAAGLTHQPMVNALTAGAAAMNAIHEGDSERYTRAYEAWKDNTELVFKRHQAMMDDYKVFADMKKDDLAGRDRQLQIFGATHDDQVALAERQRGDVGLLESAMATRQSAILGMMEHWSAIQDDHEKQMRIFQLDDAWAQTPEGQAFRKAHPNATPNQFPVHWDNVLQASRQQAEAKSPFRGLSMSAEDARAVEELRANNPGMTLDDAIALHERNKKMAGFEAKTQQADQKNTLLSKKVQAMIDLINADPNVVGTRGVVYGAIESAKGIYDPKAKTNEDYERFQSAMGALQDEISAAISGSKYYSQPRQAAMQKILPGLGVGHLTSAQDALTALGNIKAQLDGAASDIMLQAPGGDPGSTAPAAPNPKFDSFMKKHFGN